MPRARSCCRISFGGGGTDISPYCSTWGGCVLSAAICRYAYASISDNFQMFNPTGEGDPALIEAVARRLGAEQKLKVRVEVPPLSGLGASASIAVAACGALKPDISREQAVMTAYHAERTDLGVPGGIQDQIVAATGGILFMEIGDNRFNVERVELSKETILDLEKHLIMVLVQAREKVSSSDVLSDQIERLKKGETLELHHQLKEICLEMRRVLRHGDMDLFADLLKEEWLVKRQFSPLISNPYLNGLYDFAMNCGARSGKLMGAGGGGHFLFYCWPDEEITLIHNLQRLGFHPEHVSFDFAGLTTWEKHEGSAQKVG